MAGALGHDEMLFEKCPAEPQAGRPSRPHEHIDRAVLHALGHALAVRSDHRDPDVRTCRLKSANQIRDQHDRGIFVKRHSEGARSEEHTSELQSLMRISYAVLCLKKKKKT